MKNTANTETSLPCGDKFKANLDPVNHAHIMANKDMEMTHDTGGNGWAIVQDLGDEMVRIVSLGTDRLGFAMLAWSKRLSVSIVDGKEKPIDSKLLSTVKALRSDLVSGKKIVVEQEVLLA